MSAPSPPVIQPRPRSRDQTLTFYWTPPLSDGGSPITGYTLTCPAASFSESYSASTYSAEATGLTNATAFTFTIVATNENGNSDPVSFRPCQPGLLAPPPMNVQASALDSSGNYLVTWNLPTVTANMATINRFFVEAYDLSSSSVAVSKSTYGDQTQRYLPTIDPTHGHQFRVYTVNDNGYSAFRAPTSDNILVAGAANYSSETTGWSLSYSTDHGVTWTSSSTGNTLLPQSSTTRINSITNNGSRFLAVGSSGASYTAYKLLYSDDGNVWVDTEFDFSSGLPLGTSINLFYRNGLFNLMYTYYDPIGEVNIFPLYRSSDGLSWSYIADTGIAFLDVTDNSTRIVGCSGSLYHSTNGVDWTLGTLVGGGAIPSGGYYSVKWDGTYFFSLSAQDSNGYVYRSSDGITWTQLTQNQVFANTVVSNGSGTVIVVGQPFGEFAYKIGYSTDSGATWNPSTVSSSIIEFRQCDWDGTNFIAGGLFADGLMYSSDGITWSNSNNGGQFGQQAGHIFSCTNLPN